MTPASFRFEPLGEEHDRSAFRCGEEALDRYFQTQVTWWKPWTVKSSPITRCRRPAFALTELPPEVTKRLPRYPTLPAVRIGRLAVDEKFQGRGLAAAMLMNAVHRTLQDPAAAFTLLVDAKNDRPVAFYQHHGFRVPASSDRSRGVVPKGRALRAERDKPSQKRAIIGFAKPYNVLMAIRVVSLCVLCIAMTASAIAQNPPDAFQTATASNLNTADSFANLINAGANGTCVNIYALDQSQSLLSCCSSLLVPNQPYFFSARDLYAYLSLGGPSSITINLLASVPSGSTCDARVPGVPVSGLRAALGTAPGAGGVPFQQTPITAAQIDHLASFCAFIQTGASGFGICRGAQLFAGPAVLSLTKTHTGNFTLGQTGTYTVTVSNGAGAGPTSGTVSVTDTVPASAETLVSMAGPGWTCPGTAANNCTRSDVLAGGASYPPIMVTVNVAAQATSPQINAVNVSGGGSAAANAMDPTTFVTPVPPAVLGITKMHTGSFTQGQNGTYTLQVSNDPGAGPTVGPVTVTDMVPAGLGLVSMAGTGWACPGTAPNNCTRNDVLAPGVRYPPITVTVSVASNAAPSVGNTAAVSGGGSASAAAMDATNILMPAGPTIILTPMTLNPGDEPLLPVSLSAASPTAVFVTLTSSDPSILSLSTASQSSTGGVLIPANSTMSPGIRVVAGKAGAVTISASATGYLPTSLILQVGPMVGTAAITASGRTPQSAATNNAFASPLMATVTMGGNPVVGTPVTFTAPATGPSGSFAGGGSSATAFTNASGVATSPVFTANSLPGSFAVLASAPGAASPVAFPLTNLNGSMIVLMPLTLHVGDAPAFPVSLSAPAGDAVVVTLTSSDPTVVSLSTATIAATANVLIPADSPATSNRLRIAGGKHGTATITAMATGYAPTSVMVTVVP